MNKITFLAPMPNGYHYLSFQCGSLWEISAGESCMEDFLEIYGLLGNYSQNDFLYFRVKVEFNSIWMTVF